MLFTTDKISFEKPEESAAGKTSIAASGIQLFSSEGWAHLRKSVGDLKPDAYHHFVSEGKWSAINLLEFLLLQSGPANCWLTSWSISETAIRRIVAQKQSGNIKSAICLFDRRAANYNPAALHFASRHLDVTLMPIHAKVSVLKGDKMSFVVNQSANYNDNKRVETGIISTLPEDVSFYSSWIENLKNGQRESKK